MAFTLKDFRNIALYRVTITKEEDAISFVTFMQEEYFPAIRKDSTRFGQVHDLVMLQHNSTGKSNEFFLFATGVLGMFPQVKEEVQSKLGLFGATLEPIGDHREVAAWHATEQE